MMVGSGVGRFAGLDTCGHGRSARYYRSLALLRKAYDVLQTKRSPLLQVVPATSRPRKAEERSLSSSAASKGRVQKRIINYCARPTLHGSHYLPRLRLRRRKVSILYEQNLYSQADLEVDVMKIMAQMEHAVETIFPTQVTFWYEILQCLQVSRLRDTAQGYRCRDGLWFEIRIITNDSIESL